LTGCSAFSPLSGAPSHRVTFQTPLTRNSNGTGNSRPSTLPARH
jgi:hypothetical protein